MDLCDNSSDESVSVVTSKLSPVKIGLQQKLLRAKGIFGGSTPKRKKIDVCSSSSWEDAVEQILTVSKRPRNSKVFDQVYHADKDEFKTPTMQPSMLLSVSHHSSDIVNDTEWTECGLFSMKRKSFEAMPLSDVFPAFSPSELSFFTDMKLYNIGDLRRVNINGLSIHLLESVNFRKACVFYAWKDRKPLHDYLRFTVARNTVIKWKKSVAQQNHLSKTANESVKNKKDAESNKQTMSPADSTEMEDTETENTEANDIPLTSLLSNEEARLLRDHFGIDTATQLINANPHIRQTLSGIMAPRFDGRSLQEIKCICEGMLYSWLLRSREAVESTESSATSMETETSDLCATLSYEDEQITRPKIQTPLSYIDYLFFREVGISTDHELSLIDPSLLTRQYTAFLNAKGKDISYVDANKMMKRLRHEAFLVSSGVSNATTNPPQNTRLDLAKLPQAVMLNASNLCKTTIDENNSGLPKKTLIVYDGQNNVLYEFSVSIRDSSIPDSGKGAFLTFK